MKRTIGVAATVSVATLALAAQVFAAGSWGARMGGSMALSRPAAPPMQPGAGMTGTRGSMTPVGTGQQALMTGGGAGSTAGIQRGTAGSNSTAANPGHRSSTASTK